MSFEDQDIENEVYEELLEKQEEAKIACEALERSFDTYFALENLYEEASKPNTDKKLIAIATEMAVLGTNVPSTVLYHPEISLEDIAQRKSNFIIQIYDSIKQSIQKNIDLNHYLMTFFNIQRARLNKLRKQLNNLSDKDTATVSVHLSKYMLIGKNGVPVSDIDEYLQEYKKMASVMLPFMKSIKELTDDDLFTTLTMLKHAVTFSSDKYFKDRFDSLEKAIMDASRSSHLKVEEKKTQFTTYASDLLLGLSQVVITMPNKAIYNKNDYSSLVDSLKHFYMYVYRTDKIRFTTALRGSNKYEISVKTAKELLSINEELLNAINGLLDMTTSLSTNLTQYTSGILHMQTYRDKTEDYNPGGVFRSTRILNRISAIIYESVASSYNFSLGNLKKSCSITESMISKLN
jgi:hypothetical protein